MKKMNWLLSLTVFCALASVTAPAATLYVWQESPSPGPPYADWFSAATNIQDAVDAAQAGDTVLVVGGVYDTGGRAVVGTMTNRVVIDKAIRVESLMGPEVTIIEGCQVPGTTNGDDAIRCVYLASGAVLSGFTLTDGATRTDGDWSFEQSGGGLWCESSGALATNCILAGNSACYEGGGVLAGTLHDCTLRGNSAQTGGGAAGTRLDNCTLAGNSANEGGGAYGATLLGCILEGNTANSYGGAMSEGTLEDCRLTGNSAQDGGGVAWSELRNCTLAANSAGSSGGGAFNATLNNCNLTGSSAWEGGGASGSTLNNCTLNGNSANDGGGAFGGTLNNCSLTGNSATEGGGAGYSTLNNCILYFNTAAFGPNYYDGALNFCCTTPLPSSGSGNITADPQLASASHLSASSPCWRAGSAAYATGTDIDGEPWASPPSIGCDEYWPGSTIGSLSVTIGAAFTNVAAGFMVSFTALIEGPTAVSVWDFGDKVTLSNQPYANHAWSLPGDYAFVLTAYNDSYPQGVSATQMVHVVAQPVLHVAVNGTNPTAPYTSWDTAATTIQDALDAATVTGALVPVTNGVYASVSVNKPVALTSVNGPATTVVNGGGATRCVWLGTDAVLSGFTLTNGSAYYGGGVWSETTGSVSNCVISSNSACFGGGAYGGRLYHCILAGNRGYWIYEGVAIRGVGGGAYGSTLEDCILAGNLACMGGGACLSLLSNCQIVGNRTTRSVTPLGDDQCEVLGEGGGASRCTLHNCTLTGNWADDAGGTFDSVLDNCTLIGNSAVYSGGGASGGMLKNCTLVSNAAGEEGGGASVVYAFSSCWSAGLVRRCIGVASLNNCIVYSNTAPNCPNYDSGSTLNYCCTTPLPTNGFGNITNAPLFVDIAGGNLRLTSNSPCINAGNNSCVIDHHRPRRQLAHRQRHGGHRCLRISRFWLNDLLRLAPAIRPAHGWLRRPDRPRP